MTVATNHLTHDPAARERYRGYQDALIGDPREHGWRDWPTFTGNPIPKADAVHGWRVFGVVGIGRDRSRLVAPYRPDWEYPPARWLPGTNTSRREVCRADVKHHPSAAGFCRCGFRMVQSLSVMEAFLGNQAHRFSTLLAIAEVQAWGRVAPYAPDDDWQYTARAERMRIIGPLYMQLDCACEHGESLAEHYRVDVAVLGGGHDQG
mgnify:CR=1 FL=1